MEPTTKNSTLRSLLIFFVIGAILLAVVILGVRWARGRSDQLASKTPIVATDAQKTADEQKASDDQRAAEQRAAEDKAKQDAAVAQQKKDNEKKVTAITSTSPQAPVATPATVPSAGMEDAFLPIAALAALVFAGTTYAQSRRRLVRLS
jgi:FtsZ-interacting cell division protein ZipA